MALSDPKNTLAHHSARALTTYRDMSGTPTSAVAAAIVDFRANDKAKHTSPQGEALWFYGMNHVTSILRQKRHPLEPLGKTEEALLTEYYDRMSPCAVRAFYYLVIVCIREARHNLTMKGSHHQHVTKTTEMRNKFGKVTADWFINMGGGEETIHEKFLQNPPATTIGNFLECVAWQFYKCAWSSAYGGKAWGNIADCALKFVKGEFTAEMMLDTIWTLEHNTSTVFNKGHFYASPNTAALQRILDVQRSGQVPHLIVEGDVKVATTHIEGYVAMELKEAINEARALWPSEIGEHVDWQQVQSLGALGGYHKEINWQNATWACTPEMKAKAAALQLEAEQKAKAAAEAQALKEKAQKAAEAQAKIDHAKNWLEIMPNVEVKIVHRKQAA